jgi:hypothetical protein
MTKDSNRIPCHRIQIAEHRVHVGAGVSSTREPHIDVVRDAGGIRAIRVTCRCGEVLCLDLDYGRNAA